MSDWTMRISRVPNFRAICFLFLSSLRFLDINCDAVGCCCCKTCCIGTTPVAPLRWYCCCWFVIGWCSPYDETALRSDENVFISLIFFSRRHPIPIFFFMFSAPSRKTIEKNARVWMHSHRCGIDADSLFDFVGRFTRREFSLVSLFCKSARADRMCWWRHITTSSPLFFQKYLFLISFCRVRAVTEREIKFNWAILGFVLVCCFFPSLTNTSFSFPKPLRFTSNSLSRKGKCKG